LGQLFEELKRRNVFRVAIAYLVAAWLVLQVADLVLENIGAPAWVMQVFILLFALGFPLALIFSWAYELTPEGLKREKEVDRTHSVTHHTGRKLNQITIGLLVVVVLVFAAERLLVPRPSGGPTATEAVTAPPDRSIAVLAFEDLSQGGDQEYFADGLSEELLNVLAQNPDLQVAGRTSSFAFKGQNKDLREIGELLNVANVLEGSVRKSGNRIRVTAQLINADTGFHLFSESYDRDLVDLFSVQDELAAKIANALQSELIGTHSVQEATESEIAAYDLYLAAREKIYSRDPEEMHAAVELLDRAIAMDPDYAPALAQKALGIFLLSDNEGSYGDIPTAEAVATARPLVDRALQIDPRLAEAVAISALVMDAEDTDVEDRIALLRQALDLNPSLDNARTWLASELFEAGLFEEAWALLESIVERDPMFGPAFNNLVGSYAVTREFDNANALIGRVERIVGETTDVRQAWGIVAMSQGRHAEAIRHLRAAYEANPNSTVVRLNYTRALLNLGEFETVLEVGDPGGRLIALARLGEREAALEMIEQLGNTGWIPDIFGAVAGSLVRLGDYQRLLTLVDTQFGGLDALLEKEPRLNSFGLGYMSSLAWAYRQLNMDAQYAKVLAAMEKAAAAQGQRWPTPGPEILSRLFYSAVTGDEAAMVAAARAADDEFEISDVEPFNAPFFGTYADNTEFQAIRTAIIERGNAERAKLGLPPFNPIEMTSL
jgi:TolB-like protein/Tfp pilus assembly protein PilF